MTYTYSIHSYTSEAQSQPSISAVKMQLHQLLLAAFATTAIAAPTLVERTCTPQGNGGGDTENGVVNQNCCTDVTVIFARGTSEFGNVGTFAGPPFFAALRSMLGANRVTVQGVNYPASLTVCAHLQQTWNDVRSMLTCVKPKGSLNSWCSRRSNNGRRHQTSPRPMPKHKDRRIRLLPRRRSSSQCLLRAGSKYHPS